MLAPKNNESAKENKIYSICCVRLPCKRTENSQSTCWEHEIVPCRSSLLNGHNNPSKITDRMLPRVSAIKEHR